MREGEIPDRFRAYPRRVQAMHRHLRKQVRAKEPAIASARRPVAPE
jgi:hypothetical protein